MTTELQRPVTIKLYQRYEYLAVVYAKKIWDYDRLGMTYDDVVQEFKTKIWYSVTMFLKRWKHYKATGKFKPTPLKYYLQSNLNSLIIDLSKKINGYAMYQGEIVEQIKGINSIDSLGFDIGKHPNTDTIIDWESNEIVINGIDLLKGLDDRKSSMFKLFLRGHKIKSLKKIFKGFDVSKTIAGQIDYLKQYRDDLLQDNSAPIFSFDFEMAE